MKKILTTLMIISLSVSTPSAMAIQNYSHTTTTTENYSASSPVGQFNNYSGTNIQPQIIVPNTYVPVVYNGTNAYYDNGYGNYHAVPQEPIYTANASYYNGNSSIVNNQQNIDVPQSYNRTVTTTDNYFDTRERADKVIDRGLKVIGGLALIGAVGALIVNACD